jgi:hypothetical protein
MLTYELYRIVALMAEIAFLVVFTQQAAINKNTTES